MHLLQLRRLCRLFLLPTKRHLSMVAGRGLAWSLATVVEGSLEYSDMKLNCVICFINHALQAPVAMHAYYSNMERPDA
ncbi:hypothetical protein F4679DRAFT_493828 [Xylaria curta]|nr:hypothetical protein F4679DRAFT_493828 [Xylaria curta]